MVSIQTDVQGDLDKKLQTIENKFFDVEEQLLHFKSHQENLKNSTASRIEHRAGKAHGNIDSVSRCPWLLIVNTALN